MVSVIKRFHCILKNKIAESVGREFLGVYSNKNHAVRSMRLECQNKYFPRDPPFKKVNFLF